MRGGRPAPAAGLVPGAEGWQGGRQPSTARHLLLGAGPQSHSRGGGLRAVGGHLLPDTSSWGQDPRATPRGPYGAGWGTIHCPTPPPSALKQDVPALRGQWLGGEQLMVLWCLTEGPGDQTAQLGLGAGLAGACGKGQQVLAGVVTTPSTPANRAHASLPWDAGRTAVTHADPREPVELRRPPGCREHRPAARQLLLRRRAWGAASHPTHAPCPQGSQHAGPFSADPAPQAPTPRFRTLLGRPHPASPQSLRSRTLLGRPRPTSPSSRAPGPF